MIRDSPVLLVEDNPNDVLITRRAWKNGHIMNPLEVVINGEEALKYLMKEGDYSDALTPCLILLDLKMPRVDGFEVLEVLKGDDSLRKIPVIVLTSSDRDKDLERAYQLGCNSYIVKPVKYQDFIEAVIQIKNFWLILNRTTV